MLFGTEHPYRLWAPTAYYPGLLPFQLFWEGPLDGPWIDPVWTPPCIDLPCDHKAWDSAQTKNKI